MTARATFTQAELARAIRAADAMGKVALVTRAGIAFVDPGTIPHTAPQPAAQPSPIDTWFSEHGDDQG